MKGVALAIRFSLLFALAVLALFLPALRLYLSR
jgi:hypothetical protein